MPLKLTHTLAICLMSLYLSDPAVDVQRLEGLGNLESLVCKLSKQKHQLVTHLKTTAIITQAHWCRTSIFSFFKYRVPRLVQATTFCKTICQSIKRSSERKKLPIKIRVTYILFNLDWLDEAMLSQSKVIKTWWRKMNQDFITYLFIHFLFLHM